MGERRGDEAGDPIRLAALEAFVEVSADALISQDADGRIVAWNRSAERIFGRHAEDVVGTPMRDLFPEHVRDDVVVLLDTVAGGARVDHVETEVARRDGMRIPISVSLRPVCDESGSCCGVVGVARDLTEQRLTQSALAETEARLRDAEALAHAGRWLWDVDSGAVQWSEEMHRINGVDPATFEGTLDAHLAHVHPDDVDVLRDAFTTAVSTRRPFDIEYRIRHHDGADTVALFARRADVRVDRRGRRATWVRPGHHRPSRHPHHDTDRSLRADGLADQPADTVDEICADHRRRRRPDRRRRLLVLLDDVGEVAQGMADMTAHGHDQVVHLLGVEDCTQRLYDVIEVLLVGASAEHVARREGNQPDHGSTSSASRYSLTTTSG